MIVTALIKKKKHYEITFDHQDIIEAPEDIVINYRLVKGKEIDDFTLEQIKKSIDNDVFYQMAMKQLKYQKASYQLKQYLIDKGATNELAQIIIDKLKKSRLIDDEAYLELYLTKKASIKQLKFELLQKGFSVADIDEKFEDYDEKSVLNSIAQANIKKYQDKPDGAIKMYRYLVSKGFNYADVKSIVEHYFK